MAKVTHQRGSAVRDRILELRRVPAHELRANPFNFRTHPKGQQAALRGLLAEIGVANAVIAYHSEAADGRLTLIDGHLRTDLLAAEEIPVLVLDVSDAEAATLLATMDPLAGLAETDGAVLDALLQQVHSDDAAIQALLADLAGDAEGARLSAPDGEANAERTRQLASAGLVKLVVAGADLGVVEDAFAATGLANRAEALAAVCRGYLERHAAQG
jgi:hypothetical protein